MSRNFTSERLDVAEFSQAKGHLAGQDTLQAYGRLAKEMENAPPDLKIDWEVDGERRKAADGAMRPGLHLRVHATFPMVCQLCMGEVQESVEVDQHFIFVDDEESAAALDDVSDEDVLVLSTEFSLHGLIEDELLMALPLVPRHDVCPEAPRLSAEDPEFEQAMQTKPNPFAALASLKTPKKSN